MTRITQFGGFNIAISTLMFDIFCHFRVAAKHGEMKKEEEGEVPNEMKVITHMAPTYHSN